MGGNSAIQRFFRALALCLSLLWPTLALGQDLPIGGAADLEGPTLIRADEVSYDEKLQIVTARGDVEISQNNRVLIADTVSYNTTTGVVTASGNITLREPDGNLVFGEYVELKDDLREGFIRDIGVLLTDNSRLAASSGERSAGIYTLFRKGVYSPCELCREDPSKAPLWQIRAAEVLHDQEDREIEYRDAWLEFFGVPVLYTPYFSHPDPTVRRKSGFLAPSFGVSKDLGFSVQVPYFWAIDEDKDLTFEPIYTSKQGVVVAGEYRHLFPTGEFSFAGSGTIADRTVRRNGRNVDQTDRLRGHLETFGRFDIDETWRWGFDGNRSSDGTYLRVYDFSNDRTLTSRLFAEGFDGRSYAAANAYAYQGLRATDDNDEFPLVAPLLDVNYISDPGIAGGVYRFDANAAVLTRLEGRDTRRVALTGSYELPYTSPLGDVYSITARLIADGYWTNGNDPGSNDVNPAVAQGDDFDGRILPQLAFGWRYPWVQYNENFDQVIEPVAQLVLSPGGANPNGIPNEDSLGFEFDDTNLFSLNRFPGLDRVDSSSRLDYGVNWSLTGVDDSQISAFLGQSLRLNTDKDLFGAGSGLEDHLSDTVGRIRVNPIREVDILYRFRLDNEKFALQRSELNAVVGVPALNLRADYLSVDQSASAGEFADREELTLSLRSQLNENWSISGQQKRDLVDNRNRSVRLGFTYQDECLLFSTTASRTFFKDRDLEPEDTIFFQLVFKHLGGVSSN